MKSMPASGLFPKASRGEKRMFQFGMAAGVRTRAHCSRFRNGPSWAHRTKTGMFASLASRRNILEDHGSETVEFWRMCPDFPELVMHDVSKNCGMGNTGADVAIRSDGECGEPYSTNRVFWIPFGNLVLIPKGIVISNCPKIFRQRFIVGVQGRMICPSSSIVNNLPAKDGNAETLAPCI